MFLASGRIEFFSSHHGLKPRLSDSALAARVLPHRALVSAPTANEEEISEYLPHASSDVRGTTKHVGRILLARTHAAGAGIGRRNSRHANYSESSCLVRMGALKSARAGEHVAAKSWSRLCLGLRPWCEEKNSILPEAKNIFEWP